MGDAPLLCSAVTLSAAPIIWPLRSRQVSISQAGWLTLSVAIGRAAAWIQTTHGGLRGVSTGLVFGVLAGLVVAAELLLPVRMIGAPIVAAVAALLLYAVNPDVHLWPGGYLAMMMTCGVTVTFITRYLNDGIYAVRDAVSDRAMRGLFHDSFNPFQPPALRPRAPPR